MSSSTAAASVTSVVPFSPPRIYEEEVKGAHAHAHAGAVRPAVGTQVRNKTSCCKIDPNLSLMSSICGKAFLLMANMAFLHPSTVKTQNVEAGTSIADTFNNENIHQFLKKTEKTQSNACRYTHIVVAGLTRIVFGVAVVAVISPLGVVINGSICLFYLARFTVRKIIQLITKTPSDLNHDWEKVHQYARALITDLIPIGLTITGGLACALGLYAQEGEVFIVGIGLMALFPGAVAFDPEYALQIMADPDKRAGLMKSIHLRKEYGIVDATGNLLPTGEVDDETAEKGGHCSRLYNQIACDIGAELLNLKDMYPNLEIPNWDNSDNVVWGRSHYKDNFINALAYSLESEAKDEIRTNKRNIKANAIKDEDEDDEVGNKKPVVNPAILQAKQDKANKILEKIKLWSNSIVELNGILVRALECRENSWTKQGKEKLKATVPIPAVLRFASQLKSMDSENNWNVSGLSPYTETPPFTDEELKQLYINFKGAVIVQAFRKEPSPKNLLAITEELRKWKDLSTTAAEAEENHKAFLNKIKKAYLKLTIVLHPDKIKQLDGSSETQIAEAGILFNILQVAYTQIKASKPKVIPQT